VPSSPRTRTSVELDVRTLEAVALYDKFAVEYQAALRRKRPVADLRRFAAMTTRGDLVLDAGCGPATDLRLLRDAGVHPVGVDLSRAALSEARMLLPRHPLVVAPIQQLPFKARSFGGLWLSGSFNHLRRDEWASTFTHLIGLLDRGPVHFSCILGDRDLGAVEDPTLGRVHRTDATEQQVMDMMASHGLRDLQVSLRPDPILERRRPWVVGLGRRV
jgi:SAM-dependent methyltransferase